MLKAMPPPPFPAEVALARQGLRPYVPDERSLVRRNRWTKQKVTQRRTLIPGFALIRILEEEHPVNWLRLLAIPYVIGIYGKVEGIPDRHVVEIEQMQRRLWTNNPYGLAVGDLADIAEGPMKGHEIEITAVEPSEEIIKGLTYLFGAKVEITMPIASVHGVKIPVEG